MGDLTMMCSRSMTPTESRDRPRWSRMFTEAAMQAPEQPAAGREESLHASGKAEPFPPRVASREEAVLAGKQCDLP